MNKQPLVELPPRKPLHVYRTDFAVYKFDPKWFDHAITAAARKAGDAAFNDKRFKVARVIAAWAERMDAAG